MSHMSEPKRLRSEFGADFGPAGGTTNFSFNDPAGDGPWSAPTESTPSALTLSLKIKKDQSGNFSASTTAPLQLEVNAAEEAQVSGRRIRWYCRCMCALANSPSPTASSVALRAP